MESQRDKKPFIIVAIPVYNEEETIAKEILKAKKYADKIIICDDGSADSTAEIAKSLGVDVIRHKRNLGYGAAIQSLFKRAKRLDFNILVTLDGDGQHDPDDIPKVIKPIIDDEADIVIGSRFVGNSLFAMPWYRRVGVKLITNFVNYSTKPSITIEDAQSGFRAYSRKALKTLKLTEKGMSISVEILFEAWRHHLRIKEVPIRCCYGKGIKGSTHNPIMHGINLVIYIVRRIIKDRTLRILNSRRVTHDI